MMIANYFKGRKFGNHIQNGLPYINQNWYEFEKHYKVKSYLCKRIFAIQAHL